MRGKCNGEAFPVAERVSQEGSRYVGASVSENGTLVYGGDDSLAVTQLTWRDRTGRALGTVGGPAPYLNLALSPEERRVAVAVGTVNLQNVDIWIIDMARNGRSRLTGEPGVARFAGVVARRHANRLPEPQIGEVVVA